MKHFRKRRRFAHAALVAAAVLVACPGLSGASFAHPSRPADARFGGTSQAVSPAPDGPVSASRSLLTLVTGDRVAVEPDKHGRPHVTVDPDRRNGRSVHFSIRSSGGDVYVMPSDVADLVPKVLDRELFNVTAQMRMGYGDRERSSLPLIVQRAPGVGTLTDPAYLRLGKALGSIGGAAAELPKSQTRELGRRLDTVAGVRSASPSSAGATLAGIGHIWLDGRTTIDTWDSNLTRIGAPEAWDAGHDGGGTTVAVLDTGVDSGHPDLAGQVGDTASFTGSPDADDDNGHGTHVASLIAGTGAASHGTRRGVAYKAHLLVGKVLDGEGAGLTSWAIAGMQWAAAHHADIVNMSLGAPANGGDSPLTQAAQNLSASGDTLFVVAAGNDGPAPGSINAPGDASDVLTVGAVGTDDTPLGRSSRGPTVSGGRVKPDLTAPGLSIIGAKAGARGDDPYTLLSGTSQATPQVAGAAALQLQEHPGWTAQQIKSVLVTTAGPHPGNSVYAQGAGRLTIPQALKATVTTNAAEVDFGLLKWPHTRAVTQGVTFSNTGSAPVTLDLSERSAQTGSAAIASVSPDQVTIPAGGTADATVTLDAGTAKPGNYEGELDAVSDGTTVLRLATGAEIEPERYDVSISVTDHLGRPYAGGHVDVVNADHVDYGSWENVILDKQGRATLRVPPGWYSVMSRIVTDGPDDSTESTAFAGDPEVHVAADTHVDIDARNAQPLRSPVVPHAKTKVDWAQVWIWRFDNTPGRAGYAADQVFAGPEDINGGRVLVQPTTPVRHGSFWFTTQWRLLASGHHRKGSPDLYDLVRSTPTVSDPPAFPITEQDVHSLARLDTTYHALGEKTETVEERVAFSSRQIAAITSFEHVTLPSHRIEMVSTDPGTIWYQSVLAPDDKGYRLNQDQTSYQPRERRTVHWFRTLHPEMIQSIRRPADEGEQQYLDTGMGDGEHAGSFNAAPFESAHLSLRSAGATLGEVADTYGNFTVPNGRGDFTAEQDLALPPSTNPVSARSHTTWGFSSSPSTDPDQPASESCVVRLDYQPTLDRLGRAPAGRPLRFGLRVTHNNEVPAPAGVPRTVRLWYSVDSGLHWTPARVRHEHGDQYGAVFRAPGAAKAISVRASVVDAGGNSIDQTVLGLIPVH